MILNKDTVAAEKCDPLIYSGQLVLQKILFVVAIICVPWMLLAKPVSILRSRRNKMNYSVSKAKIKYRSLVLFKELRK